LDANVFDPQLAEELKERMSWRSVFPSHIESH
jgi:hypothetical protein